MMTHLVHSNKIYHRYPLNRLFQKNIPIYILHFTFKFPTKIEAAAVL